MPAEQLQIAHEKALADFNRGKAHRLEQISNDGKAVMAEARRLEQDNIGFQGEIEQISNKLNELKIGLTASEAELTELRSGIQDPKVDPEYQRLMTEKATVQNELTQLSVSVKDEITRVQSDICNLQAELRMLEENMAKFAQVLKTEQRIAELEQQERTLAAEYERLQEELFLTEEFTRSKVALLDSKINSKFKYARFRLFGEQINGGLKEVCDTLFDGVPYDGGLNKAAQNNVGMDIINTLSEHYGFSAPIFLDNAESVTKPIDTDAQVIRLIVSEEDKKLRVVTQNSSMQEEI